MPDFPLLRDLARTGMLVEIGCDACKSITYIDPENLHLKMNMQVSLLANFYPCPNCGAYNHDENNSVWIRPDQRKHTK
jgi:hypothetical protein